MVVVHVSIETSRSSSRFDWVRRSIPTTPLFSERSPLTKPAIKNQTTPSLSVLGKKFIPVAVRELCRGSYRFPLSPPLLFFGDVSMT